MDKSEPTKLVVAAIDFGTTYSGYAYSFRNEYKRDPLKIYANTRWSDVGEGLFTLKTPTIILFNESKEFHSFGFEAESNYSKLASANQHKGWRYFKRFKMKLSGTVNRENIKIADDLGNRMSATDVFSASIAYLKDHLLGRLNLNTSGILESDIYWVITIPAIWNDGAKQFMKKAAIQAGIAPDQLTLALEPEAAAIYCKELTLTKRETIGMQAELRSFDSGSQFMVIDLGGGTVDITVHEVESDGTLTELYSPTGGPWGGTLVDEAFMEFMKKLFKDDTSSVMQSFSNDCKEDELALQRAYELVKRTVSAVARTDIVGRDSTCINVPEVLYKLFEKETGIEFGSYLMESDFATMAEMRNGNKLFIMGDVLREMFQQPKQKLVTHLQDLLQKPEMRRLKTLIMVGGFSESAVMYSAVQKAFAGMTIIVPEEAGLAVVKGAVIYGHNKDAVRSRRMSHTYGISVTAPFNSDIHPVVKKQARNGLDICEDIFKVFVRAGESVIPGVTSAECSFNWPFSQQLVTIEVYKTLSIEPKFVTEEGCEEIGKVEIQLENQTAREVKVIMTFGGTELQVGVKENATNKFGDKVAFNFLC